MSFFYIADGTLTSTTALPPQAHPFTERARQLLPPQISTLHEGFQAWGGAGYSPGPIAPDRLWLTERNQLMVHSAKGSAPRPLMQTGLAADLAAWLVLLDKWMETFVVVARARAVWSVAELAGALTYTTPAYLPPALVKIPPDNWQRVARALAIAVADGPLRGRPSDRHWQEAFGRPTVAD
jgi:hypothetical protein